MCRLCLWNPAWLLEFTLSGRGFSPCTLEFAFMPPAESCFPRVSQLLPEPSRAHRSTYHHNSAKVTLDETSFSCAQPSEIPEIFPLNEVLERILPSASWCHIFILTEHLTGCICQSLGLDVIWVCFFPCGYQHWRCLHPWVISSLHFNWDCRQISKQATEWINIFTNPFITSTTWYYIVVKRKSGHWWPKEAKSGVHFFSSLAQ